MVTLYEFLPINFEIEALNLTWQLKESFTTLTSRSDMFWIYLSEPEYMRDI